MKFLATLFTLFYFGALVSQSSYFPKGHNVYRSFDRMDIKSSLDLNLHSSIKQWSRKDVVAYISALKKEDQRFSVQDSFNLQFLLDDNLEYSQALGSNYLQKKEKGFLRNFYKSKANFLEIRQADFEVFINPIFNFRAGKEQNTSALPFQNTRGIELRGLIDQKVYFYTSLFENQARFFNYIENYIDENSTIPGQGFYKTYDSSVSSSIYGWDFANAIAYFGFPISKHISFELGHGNHFIGNGYRSLLLSDFANNYFYMKLGIKVWKFHYQSIFAELSSLSALLTRNSTLLSKKYMAHHYLSFKPHPNFEIGFFESVIYGRENHFEFQYLNPVILYRTAELQLNSPDNVIIGFNGKWDLFKTISLYGQLVLDEFRIGELTAGEGWWGNKYGLQAGFKYIDAFGVNNLDIRAEANIVRPFTYTHRDTIEGFNQFTIANYSHYGQALAHPLGANFVETILTVDYQAFKRWHLNAKFISAKKGDDENGDNFGGNILRPSEPRNGDYGYSIAGGLENRIFTISTEISYNFAHNYFVDLHLLLRDYDSENNLNDLQTNYFGIGLRANVANFKIDY